VNPTDNSDSICQKVTTRDLVESTQMSKAGSTDLATVGSLAAVTDKEDSHFTLGGLNGGVGLTRRDGVSLGEEKEVVDQSLHILLHGGTGRGRDLVVFDTDRTSGHLVQALVNDAQGLAELLHTAKVTVVAVTVDTNGNVELNLIVGIVGLRLADIPRDTRTTEHNTSETHVEGVSRGDNTNTLSSGLPDTVICKQLLGLVNAVAELGGPLVDIVEKAKGKVLRYTTRADICSVQTGTGDTLVELLLKMRGQCIAPRSYVMKGKDAAYHELLTLLETPQERCQSTNVHGVGKNRHEMVQDTRNLAEQSADPLGSLGNFDVKQLLNSQREALLIRHHRDIVKTIEVGQSLHVGLVLDQLLGTTVQQTDMGI
jgi:hypothetical protein